MPWSLSNDAAWAAMVDNQVPWQSHPIIAELWQARVERVSDTTPQTLDDLDVIQWMPGSITATRWPWQGLQQWLVTNCTSFTIAHQRVGGSLQKLGAGCYDNTNYVGNSINKFTAYKMFELAGLARSSTDYGFRHATTWPANWMDANDPAYSLVLPTAISSKPNGILGPWVLYDLWKCMNLLVWIERTTIWRNTNNPEVPNTCSKGIESQASLDACYAYIAAHWGEDSSYTLQSNPQVLFRAFANPNGNPPGPSMWINRWKGQFAFSVMPSLPGAVVDWYIAARAYDNEFDAYGDDVLEEKWRAVATGTPLANVLTGGPWLGSLDLPANRPPAVTPDGSTRSRGWTPRNHIAICRCDIPSGFEYQFDI